MGIVMHREKGQFLSLFHFRFRLRFHFRFRFRFSPSPSERRLVEGMGGWKVSVATEMGHAVRQSR